MRVQGRILFSHPDLFSPGLQAWVSGAWQPLSRTAEKESWTLRDPQQMKPLLTHTGTNTHRHTHTQAHMHTWLGQHIFTFPSLYLFNLKLYKPVCNVIYPSFWLAGHAAIGTTHPGIPSAVVQPADHSVCLLAHLVQIKATQPISLAQRKCWDVGTDTGFVCVCVWVGACVSHNKQWKIKWCGCSSTVQILNQADEILHTHTLTQETVLCWVMGRKTEVGGQTVWGHPENLPTSLS